MQWRLWRWLSLYTGHSSAAAWADVGENLNKAQTVSLKVAVHQGKELREEQEMDASCGSDEGEVETIDWRARLRLGQDAGPRARGEKRLCGDSPRRQEAGLAKLAGGLEEDRRKRECQRDRHENT